MKPRRRLRDERDEGSAAEEGSGGTGGKGRRVNNLRATFPGGCVFPVHDPFAVEPSRYPGILLHRSYSRAISFRDLSSRDAAATPRLSSCRAVGIYQLTRSGEQILLLRYLRLSIKNDQSSFIFSLNNNPSISSLGLLAFTVLLPN